MTTPTCDKDITALLVVDPYNDFISEGGKIWPRMKSVAEANNCVPNLVQILNAARGGELRKAAENGIDPLLADEHVRDRFEKVLALVGWERPKVP